MTTIARALLLWVPRVFGIAVCLFVAMFALDALQTGQPAARAALDLSIHLAPATLLLSIVVLSWRRQWIGGVAFIALAAVYALVTRSRLDWIAAISGPCLAAGLLFFWSWRHRGKLRTNTSSAR